jgi:hypothetical protein
MAPPLVVLTPTFNKMLLNTTKTILQNPYPVVTHMATYKLLYMSLKSIMLYSVPTNTISNSPNNNSYTNMFSFGEFTTLACSLGARTNSAPYMAGNNPQQPYGWEVLHYD